MAYAARRLQSFIEGLNKFQSLSRQIERRIDVILKEPASRSHELGVGKWEDLRGKRSAHILGGKLVLVLAICDECIPGGHLQRNLPQCGNACPRVPEKTVILMWIAAHDPAYGRR